jgi:hypothetical protein
VKYKPGDKVTVRKDLKAGQYIDGIYVNDSMARLAGKQITIKDVFTVTYTIKEDNGFGWKDGMFEEK